MRRALAILALLCVSAAAAQGQTSTAKPAQSKPGAKPATSAKPKTPEPPPEPVPITEAAMLTCPNLLGDGVQTRRTYCDVSIGNDPASGIVVSLPPHSGDLTLSFDLHNRHTYSAEQVKAKKAFSRYTATIGVLTMNNDLLARAVVLNEFRNEADLVDRISGGSGPGGLKAVAPTGSEAITIEVPETIQSVSILGEKLSVIRLDGSDNFTAVGRPIAVISNVRVTYLPPPPPPPPKTTKPPARSTAPQNK